MSVVCLDCLREDVFLGKYGIIELVMSKNEEILRFVVANQTLEGFVVTDEEKKVLMDCLEGRRSFHDAVQDVISTYSFGTTR